MPLIAALPFSLGLVFLSSWLTATTGAPLAAFMVIGTSLWVYFDAKRIGLSRYRSGLVNPEVVTIGCFLMWIVAFPWYLNTRHRILLGIQPLKDPPAAE
jgi:hypothetical protein